MIALNIAASKWAEGYLPKLGTPIADRFREVVLKHIHGNGQKTVLDIGGGRSCPFAQDEGDGPAPRIVCIDVSESEMRLNEDVAHRVAADAVEGLPFADESVDVVVSRFLLEHLRDTEAFVQATHRILKRGGYAIHIFPCKFAPYAFANRLVTRRFSRRLIHALYPWTKGTLGFPAYYDRCHYGGVKKLLEKQGFVLDEMCFGYEQASYFFFCFPLYVLVAAYDTTLYYLGSKRLCASIALVARKS